MSVLLERPLILFLLAGLGCAVLSITGLIDAVRKLRTARRATEDRQKRPTLRFAASLAVVGILGFVALQLLSTVAGLAPRMSEALQMRGSPAPDIAYIQLDVEGMPEARVVGLGERVVLLNVWATWCPPCRREMPDLDRLQAALGDRGLTVLHVSFEDPGVLAGWLADHPMSTRHGWVGSLPFPAPALPTSLVIDREGIVRQVMVGASSYRAFEKAVEPWL